jgi:chorismate mutase
MPSPKPVCGASRFMSKYDIMTPEIEEIDKTIVLLKSKRTKLVAEAAKRKADALCAEMRKRKSK